ncbi:Holliday junction branch migration protein RuvA, partial [Salmonella enterica]|nr:Holliday junction branch migration protein RuvA [Salmonella enterica]
MDKHPVFFYDSALSFQPFTQERHVI